MKRLTILQFVIVLIMITGFTRTTMMAQGDSLMTIEPIKTDRPTQGATATLVPKGYFQMENGFSIQENDSGFVYTHPSTLWKVGVNENFELRVVTEYINIQDDPDPNVDGLLPIQVGFKAKLLEQHGIIPKASVLGHVTLPGIASKQFETTYFAPSMRLAFQNVIGDRFLILYNAGAEWNGEDARPVFLYTLAASAALFDNFRIYIEAYGDVPQQIEDDFKHRLDGGLTYTIDSNVLVDISGGIGLSDNAPEQYVAIGLSYRFKM